MGQNQLEGQGCSTVGTLGLGEKDLFEQQNNFLEFQGVRPSWALG